MDGLKPFRYNGRNIKSARAIREVRIWAYWIRKLPFTRRCAPIWSKGIRGSGYCHQEEFVGVYATFAAAGRVAVRRFGRGPYLIREIGAPPLILPASVWLRYADANG